MSAKEFKKRGFKFFKLLVSKSFDDLYKLRLVFTRFSTGCPYKQCVCLCSKNKEMYGRILKNLHIVNLCRGMSKLKLKIKVNLPQLLCIVVSVALNGEFERFIVTVNAKPTKSLKFAI